MIKLQIYSSGLGSSVFLSRLKSYLIDNFPIKMVDKNPDIYLSSVWRGKPPKGCKIIHRVDGVYFDKLNKKRDSLNRSIRDAINGANGVVYQSLYSKKMCEYILGVSPKKHSIIYNGVSPLHFNGIKVVKNEEEIRFLACAKWRPLKRPMSIIKGFIEAKIPNSKLYMIGDIDNCTKHTDVVYCGNVDSKKIYEYYKNSNALIHISRLDACPNAVVEALVCGIPVVCNNVGGTPEIVKSSGVILDIDPELEYKPFKMKKPDSVDPEIIANGLKKCISQSWNIVREDLFIENCAKQYVDFFNYVLNS